MVSIRRVLCLSFLWICAWLQPAVVRAQGPLTNGAIHEAAISGAGEIDVWTFPATQGDSLLLDVGEVGGNTTFAPWIQLQNPSGTIIASSSGPLVGAVTITAPVSGTYTVLVSSGDSGRVGTGTYRLTLVRVPGSFTISPGDDGGALSNGANHVGTIYTGDLDVWTFTANKDDYLVLSVGKLPAGAGDAGFAPWIRLYGPTGTLLGSSSGVLVGQVSLAAPLTGSYTVVISSGDSGLDGAGTYTLTLARAPGAFVASAGDPDGPLTNGAMHTGAIFSGDLDMWSFSATKGDYLVVSAGELPFGEVDPGFSPWVRLVGPDGTLLGSSSGVLVGQVSLSAPLSGAYTVIVSSADSGLDAAGDYRITLVKAPGALTVTPGDEGGDMASGANYSGHISAGDLDAWTLTANKDDYLIISVGEPPFGEVDPGFAPWIRLIGPNGTLLGSSSGTLTGQIALPAPLTGSYTVIVSTADNGLDAEGNYRLTFARPPAGFVVNAEPDGSTAPEPTDNDGGALVNGAIHDGTIRMGDLDQWSIAVNAGESLVIAVGEKPFGEVDPGFAPWIRLFGPNGALLGSSSGTWVGLLNVTATLTGVYTAVVGTGDSGLDAVGTYRITAVKAPGTIVTTAGDTGGPITTDNTPVAGDIYRGDLDPWTFTAPAGATITARATEPPFGEVDPGFSPWMLLFGPTGTLLASQSGVTTAQISMTAPSSGTYTIVVLSGDSGSDAEGHYELAVHVVPANYTVTSSAGANGTIDPLGSRSVPGGSVLTYVLTPAAGYQVNTVTGCGGALSGNTYTTATIAASCSIVATFKPAPLPVLSLDKTALTFGAVNNGVAFVTQTGGQIVRLRQSGAGTVTWIATPTQPWLHITPASGSGPADLTVTVSRVAGLPLSGTVSGSIGFSFTGAANNPGPITVPLNLTPDPPPIGVIDTPTDNRTGVTGAVPFTGWAVDDIGIARVSICRSPVAGEFAPVDPNCGNTTGIFIGFAVTIDGARPDVAAAFPTYPANSFAGWGFMVLTNMLPNQGNGTYVFRAYAQDLAGHTTVLGTRTMTCANAQATLPFGAIDTPAQGGTAAGSSYVNFGWALTPQPKTIPTDGSTITVLVDGLSQGHASYNNFRSDIATLFPGLNNTNAAVGFKVLDTTAFANGTHTIVWVVTDNQGATEGIGSRFFTISNSSAISVAPPPGVDAERLEAVPLASGPVESRRGFDLEAGFAAVGAERAGSRHVIRAEEVDRVEVRLGFESGRRIAGYLRTPDGLAALPIGSSLDEATGTFTWAPGVGFVGPYDFVFVALDDATPVARREVRIVLQPKGRGAVGPQVVIDTPTRQQDVGQPFMLAGWAADLGAKTGTGINTVHVWAYPLTGAPPIFLGVASPSRRPDVASFYGAQFGDAGYGLIVDGLTPGNYDLAVFAGSAVTGDFLPATVVRVTVR